uniref:Uncharacterized protein n=1 Tax=Arundo donax TaxID=35708 RepID=A0A0A9F1F0_ARUDO
MIFTSVVQSFPVESLRGHNGQPRIIGPITNCPQTRPYYVYNVICRLDKITI